MSQAPEPSLREGDVGRAPPGPRPLEQPPDRASPHLELRCCRCAKPIRDLEMELYFLQTGLCFWCAYVDPQG